MKKLVNHQGKGLLGDGWKFTVLLKNRVIAAMRDPVFTLLITEIWILVAVLTFTAVNRALTWLPTRACCLSLITLKIRKLHLDINDPHLGNTGFRGDEILLLHIFHPFLHKHSLPPSPALLMICGFNRLMEPHLVHTHVLPVLCHFAPSPSGMSNEKLAAANNRLPQLLLQQLISFQGVFSLAKTNHKAKQPSSNQDLFLIFIYWEVCLQRLYQHLLPAFNSCQDSNGELLI